jgi:hypothetical protein
MQGFLEQTAIALGSPGFLAAASWSTLVSSMAARTIVTFHPDVACDVCGRRLLRGEQPDVFLGGGQRRTVCELCTPRATHEGWRREIEEHVTSPRERRPQRGRSLLGRFRQLREPARPARAARVEPDVAAGAGEQPVDDEQWPPAATEWSEVETEWDAVGGETLGEAAQGRAVDDQAATATIDLDRALAVFNAGEHPRRVAGVTRALGPACVKTVPVAGSQGTVAIVVAWELCWYRYEIDLTDEAAGVRLAAEGMDLEELPEDDRVANATADERGELSLLAV